MTYSCILIMSSLLYCDVRPEIFVEDEVDIIEINHYYREDGSLSLDQIIYYKWKPTNVLLGGKIVGGYGFEVVDWRSIPKHIARENLSVEDLQKKRDIFLKKWNKKYPNTDPPPFTPDFVGGSYMPRKDPSTGYYYQTFLDSKYNYTYLPRKIKCKAVIETWTQYDPEVEARDLISNDHRIKLSRPLIHYE